MGPIDPIDSQEKRDLEEQELEALEEALRKGLREPMTIPKGFAQRVLERVAAQQSEQSEQSARAPAQQPMQQLARSRAAGARPVRWQAIAAVAAMVAVLGATSGIWQGRQAKHQAAVEAQQQLVLALRITDASLRGAGQRVDRQLAQSAARAIGEEQ